MTFDKPKDWPHWLDLAEWWYNTSYHSAIKMCPYEVVYGQKPPSLLPYLPFDSQLELVDSSLQAREATIRKLKFHLSRAQHRMKQEADKHRTERPFAVGDWVFVKLQPYRQLSLKDHSFKKLSAKFFGPFQIIARVGSVAYTLDLPSGSKVHPTFHVSQLKRNLATVLLLLPCLWFILILVTSFWSLKPFWTGDLLRSMEKPSRRSWLNGLTLPLRTVLGRSYKTSLANFPYSILEDKDSVKGGVLI